MTPRCDGRPDGGELKALSFLQELCRRPEVLTEVRRDGRDTAAVAEVIEAEFWTARGARRHAEWVGHMRVYASACWSAALGLQRLAVRDSRPENERPRHDPDHWYEINLTNQALFANLSLAGLEPLVPGRLFTTRMPRDISCREGEGANCTRQYRQFMDRCRANQLRVVLVLTESEEFRQYSGMDGLLDYYRQTCRLTAHHLAIPDFQIPTGGELVRTILDLVFHLAQGQNCLVHCAGGTGRTGMVAAAILKTLGVYDPVARVRRVKSTYVETLEQERFLREVPKALDCRIVTRVPMLAKAVAAEHLIQLFYTPSGPLASQGSGCSSVATKDQKALLTPSTPAILARGGDSEAATAISCSACSACPACVHLVRMNAFRGTFDLLDSDQSGTLDREELLSWLSLCGAELDLRELEEALCGLGPLHRETFAQLLCSSSASSRRAYEV